MNKRKINLNGIRKAVCDGETIKCTIYPFQYIDGRKPRLPRKSSKGYNLKQDIDEYFKFTLDNILLDSSARKYGIEIIIFKGNDLLGTADLDNYAKAILDGITNTKLIWQDDRQIDVLCIQRKYIKNEHSHINVEIKIL